MNALFRKTTIAGAIVIGSIASAAAVFADHDEDDSFYTYGQVVAVEPIIRQVDKTIPKKECRQVRHKRLVHHDHHDGTILSSLVGGLLGGVIGRQFGGGRGKTALTIAGAFAGASIAKASAHPRRQDRHTRGYGFRQHCTIVDQVHRVEIVEGYRVTYLYQDREFTRTTQLHPGTRIRLRVQVNPVAETLVSGYDELIEGQPSFALSAG